MIAFERAFHGRTLMAMSLTSKQHPYKAGMGPFAPEVYRAPYPYAYRGDAIDATRAALDELREMFTTHVAPENVAAIIFEPVQGEGGFIVPPKEWVQGLRQIADEHGIVLIADEVQSGYRPHRPDVRDRALRRRTGHHHRRQVDSRRRADLGRARPGRDRGPRGRQHDRRHLRRLAARLRGRHRRAGQIEQRDLLARGRAIGERMRSRFEAMQATYPQLGDVRGLGPMLAIEFVKDPATKEPAPELATAIAEGAMQRGLMILKAGIHGQVPARARCPWLRPTSRSTRPWTSSTRR